MLRQFLYRWTAFAFFACAAFAWVPPLVDRAGLAALGFGFLALSLGRAWGVARPGIPPMPPDFTKVVFPDPASLNNTAVERIGAYSDDDGR